MKNKLRETRIFLPKKAIKSFVRINTYTQLKNDEPNEPVRVFAKKLEIVSEENFSEETSSEGYDTKHFHSSTVKLFIMSILRLTKGNKPSKSNFSRKLGYV